MHGLGGRGDVERAGWGGRVRWRGRELPHEAWGQRGEESGEGGGGGGSGSWDEQHVGGGTLRLETKPASPHQLEHTDTHTDTSPATPATPATHPYTTHPPSQ